MTNVTLWPAPGWRSHPRRRPGAFAEMDSWLRDVFDGPDRTGGFVPAAEVARDGEDAVVRLELPGIDVEKDVTVEVVDGQLVIHGERRDERAEDNDGRSLREVRYGAFRRRFTLPSHVSSDAISADYDKGVLTIRVAGSYAGTQPKRIPIAG